MIGLRPDDFEAMTPRRFGAVAKAYGEHYETGLRDGWERTRIASTVIIQPQLTKRVEPRQVFPLPWDKERPGEKIPTKEEDMKDFERLMKALRDRKK